MVYPRLAVDDSLYEKAQELAQRKGISLEELWLRSLEEVVAREAADKPWMAFAGLFEGQPEDSSTVEVRGEKESSGRMGCAETTRGLRAIRESS